MNFDAVIRDGQPKEPGFDPRRLLKVEAVGVMADAFEAIPGFRWCPSRTEHFLVLFATDEPSRIFAPDSRNCALARCPRERNSLTRFRQWARSRRKTVRAQRYRAYGLPETDSVVADVELWPVPAFHRMVAAFRAWRNRRILSSLTVFERPSLYCCGCGALDKVLNASSIIGRAARGSTADVSA